MSCNERKKPNKKKEINDESASQTKLSYEEQKKYSRQVRRLEREVEELEKRMDSLQIKIEKIENQMTTPEGASDAALFREYEELKKQHNTTEEKWEVVFLELSEIKEN